MVVMNFLLDLTRLQIFAKCTDAVVKSLHSANVYIKILACKLLSHPNGKNVAVPLDRLCILLSRSVIQDKSRNHGQYSLFTSALLELCLSRINIPESSLAYSCEPLEPDLTFDDVSPLKLSDECLSATNIMDGAWLCAATTQSFEFWPNPGVKPTPLSPVIVSWCFGIDQITNRMASVGITTDAEESSCCWLGSSSVTWGIMADGSVWHNGERLSKLGITFEANDNVGFIADLVRFEACYCFYIY
jgi:hypothetical protein